MAALIATEVNIRGKKMWRVNVPASKAGKRRRVFRETEAAALSAARALINDVTAFGRDLSEVTLEERVFLREWREKMDLGEMKQALSEWYGRKGKRRTAAEGVKEFLAAPREEALSSRHLANLKSRLKKFAEAFGSREIATINAGEIEDWTRGFGASSPNYFRVIRQFFYHAERHEWISNNPIRRVQPPSPPSRVKEVFTPEQMRKALRICAGMEPGVTRDLGRRDVAERYDPLLRELVFGGLCGLRASEIRRLTAADIDMKAGKGGEIHVHGVKTARRGSPERFVSLTPAALAWIAWMKLPTGKILDPNESVLSIHRRRLAVVLGFEKWPHNVLRRSFGSYHLAAFENAALTAEQMGHTDASTTKAKYRVARRKEVAQEWFKLLPAKVLKAKSVERSACG